VRGVRLEALRESPDAFDTTLEEARAFDESEWRCWIAEGATFLLEANEATGGIAVCAPYHAEDDACLLASLWLLPSLRGMGHATRLVDAVRACAESEGARALYLHVGRENARARRFYERRGFSYTGGEVARVRDGVIELEMSLSIT
jgi:GNAT superfamily N-acetyltransferase